MFTDFIRERTYLHNVTPATVEWYKHSLKWLRSDSPSKQDLQDAVMQMREKGLKATGCNSAIRAINAYLHWKAKGVGADASRFSKCAGMEGAADVLDHNQYQPLYAL